MKREIAARKKAESSKLLNSAIIQPSITIFDSFQHIIRYQFRREQQQLFRIMPHGTSR